VARTGSRKIDASERPKISAHESAADRENWKKLGLPFARHIPVPSMKTERSASIRHVFEERLVGDHGLEPWTR
jgi:hypothetical protein